MSTVRLIENTKRFGVSIGSQTSAAPVSVEAQPPISKAAAIMATAGPRSRAIIEPTRFSTIILNPLGAVSHTAPAL